MIEPGREADVERLLDQSQFSQRAIADMSGISRGTVGAMANGKRPVDFSRRAVQGKANLDGTDEAPGPIARCPDCGGKVRIPCGACRTRRLLAAGRRRPVSAIDPHEPLTIALRDEDYERYEELRAIKIAELQAARERQDLEDDEGRSWLEPSNGELEAIERKP